MAKRRETRRKSSLAFPYEPDSERGRFIRFLDDTGSTQLFIDIFTALYNEPVKPENPILWIKDFLTSKAKCSQLDIEEEMNQLRNEIITAATEYEAVMKHLNEEKLKEENQSAASHRSIMGEVITNMSVKAERSVDEKYIEEGGDSRWQIKPDPVFRAEWSKDEIAAELDEAKKKKKQRPKINKTKNRKKELKKRENQAAIEVVDKTVSTNVEIMQYADHSTETSPQPSIEDIQFEEEEDETTEGQSEEESEVLVRKSKTPTLLSKSAKTKAKHKIKQKPVQSVSPSTTVTNNNILILKSVNKIPEPPQPPPTKLITYGNCSQCISADFWKKDLSLGKTEVSDDDNEQQGLIFNLPREKSYLNCMQNSQTLMTSKASVFTNSNTSERKEEEFSWLPSILSDPSVQANDTETNQPISKLSFLSYKFEKKSPDKQRFRLI